MKRPTRAVLTEAVNRISRIEQRKLAEDEIVNLGALFIEGGTVLTWRCGNCGRFHNRYIPKQPDK